MFNAAIRNIKTLPDSTAPIGYSDLGNSDHAVYSDLNSCDGGQ